MRIEQIGVHFRGEPNEDLNRNTFVRGERVDSMALSGTVKSAVPVSTRTASAPLWLYVCFWACLLIAGGAVVRRLLALASPTVFPPSPQLAGLDQAFASHTLLTLSHIIPAFLFVILAPIALLHRTPRLAWTKRALVPIGLVVGITAYAMSAYSIGGRVERAAVLLFNTLFLFSLIKSFLYGRRGVPALERRWLVRSVVILLGIATTRPAMGLFFATSRLTHLTPRQFFGFAFWIGFCINLIVVEAWLSRGAPRLVSKRG